MATATMGLRRRVQVSNSNGNSSTASSSSSQGTSSSSNSTGGKRSRSENNNSPSQGNLNSPESEPAPKKSRSSARSAALAKAKELELAKKVSAPRPPPWDDPRPYASIAGLSIGAQAALCAENLPSPMAYMSSTMATFVGNATNLGKSPSGVSYLDISNMTGRPSSWDEAAKGPLGLPFPPFAATPKASSSQTSQSSGQSAESAQSSTAQAAPITLPKNFPHDAMFNTYQPWVIKTYGDLAKTKTITIKKYARILRTLRGEEVNSAENSKFRFWVKSKGFHIGQPEGYDAKPADRIIGRHAVSTPGLDPSLYVPTQPPHNKALSGAEGTVPPGKIYKKVAIVENFFDIIHAVHVDLEGRPGKHAGQKRTYRTITETYAFLPREAVTRFLLGCTECQRRPRTPSPTSLAATAAAAAAASSSTSSTTTTTTTSTKTSLANGEPSSPTPTKTLTNGGGGGSATEQTNSTVKPKETSNPAESKRNSSNKKQQKPKNKMTSEITRTAANTTTAISSSTTTISSEASNISSSNSTASSTSIINTTSTTTSSSSPSIGSINVIKESKMKDEKYNPLSITNLLRKDPITRRPPIPTVVVTQPCSTHPELSTTITITSASEINSNSITNSNSHPRKMRLLPDDCIRRSTPSPVRPWSPSHESKCAPIDYSRIIATSNNLIPTNITETILREQKNLATTMITAAATTALTTATTTTTTQATTKKKSETDSSSSESESEIDEEQQRSFSPAAGLIDTNLNLLATIQQLHCQVMLALTERLRPATSSSPSLATPHGTSSGATTDS